MRLRKCDMKLRKELWRVEIVAEGLVKFFLQIRIRRRKRILNLDQVFYLFDESESFIFGLSKGFSSKIEKVGILRLEIKIPEIKRRKSAIFDLLERIGISKGFTHFPAIDLEKLVVKSVVNSRLVIKAALGLSDLVGVMNGNMIRTSVMDIKGLA